MGPIEQELENFKTKLQEEMDKPEDERSENQINFYTNTIASLELQLEEQEKQIQQHEERVQVAVQESQDWIDTVSIAGMPVESFFPDSNDFGLFKIEIKQRFTDLATRSSQQVVEIQKECAAKLQAAADDHKKLQGEFTALQEELRKSEEANHEMAGQLSQLRADVEDISSKRDNAVAELEEARGIIGQQEGHIAQLRADLLLGARAGNNVIDAEEAAKKAEMERQAQLKRVIYDLKDDGRISVLDYTAKRAIDDEEITFKAVYKNAYRVIDASEVSQFRKDNGATQPAVYEPNHGVDQTGSQDALPEVAAPELEVPQFPSQTETEHSTGDGLQLGGNPALPENGGETLDTELIQEGFQRMDTAKTAEWEMMKNIHTRLLRVEEEIGFAPKVNKAS